MKKLINCFNASFAWAQYPNQMYEYGLELGIPSEKILAAAQVCEGDLKNGELRISWMQYRAIANELSNLNPNSWGFEIGKRLHVASHGTLSLALLNCTSWPQLIDSVGLYSVLMSPVVHLAPRQSHEYLLLTAHPEFTRDAFLPQFFMGFITTVYQTLYEVSGVDFRYKPDKVCVFLPGDPPKNQLEVRNFFHGNVKWGNHCHQLRFHRSLVNSKIKSPNPAAAYSTLRVLQSQLSQLPGPLGYLRQLRELFSAGLYKQESCAEALYCSAPTLRRYLKTSNTTFSRELQDFRMDEATWELEHGDIDIGQLSDQLGFQDSSSFRRAFKKRMKLSPVQYRKIRKSKGDLLDPRIPVNSATRHT